MTTSVRILAADKSTLMEISQIEIEDDALYIRGKIMGAMPMKASVTPAELRKLFGLLGVRNILRLGWLTIRGFGGAKT